MQNFRLRLREILDRLQEKWLQWKASHPGWIRAYTVFSTVSLLVFLLSLFFFEDARKIFVQFLWSLYLLWQFWILARSKTFTWKTYSAFFLVGAWVIPFITQGFVAIIHLLFDGEPSDWWSIAVVTPIAEEIFKLLPLFVYLWLSRRATALSLSDYSDRGGCRRWVSNDGGGGPAAGFRENLGLRLQHLGRPGDSLGIFRPVSGVFRVQLFRHRDDVRSRRHYVPHRPRRRFGNPVAAQGRARLSHRPPVSPVLGGLGSRRVERVRRGSARMGCLAARCLGQRILCRAGFADPAGPGDLFGLSGHEPARRPVAPVAGRTGDSSLRGASPPVLGVSGGCAPFGAQPVVCAG